MTPIMLQDELVEEMKRLLAGNLYKTPAGEHTEMKVFPQNIPVNETDDDEDPIPYIIVRLNSGEDDGTRDSFNTVKLVIIVGIWDDSLDSQGHRDVLNIIQKVYERFHKTPNLNNIAVYDGDFNWALQEDGYYPYFFGTKNANSTGEEKKKLQFIERLRSMRRERRPRRSGIKCVAFYANRDHRERFSGHRAP